jgi:uncharacterized membrane protein YoaK (UPF0700 family)
VKVVAPRACHVEIIISLVPFVTAALPVAGLELFAGEIAELLLIAASVVLAVASMAGGCRHHRQWRPAATVAVGFASIVIGRIAFEEGAWQERAAVIGGVLCIESAHLLTWRLCCIARM